MNKAFALILLSCTLLSTLLPAQNTGIASFYAEKFEGKKTASGEIYSGDKYTAAHRLLPFGALVKVTHMGNQQAVIVKINDMGPSTPERIIHLSRVAASHLGIIENGLAQVSLEVIAEYPDEIPKGVKPGPIGAAPVVSQSQTRALAPPPQAVPQQTYTQPASYSVVPPSPHSNATPERYTNSKAEGSLFRSLTAGSAATSSPAATNQQAAETYSPPPSPPEQVVTQQSKGAGLFKFQCYRVNTSGYGLQIGAFSDYRNLLETTHILANEGIEAVLVHSEIKDDDLILRVLVGPFSTREKAKAFIPRLKALDFESHIVDLDSY